MLSSWSSTMRMHAAPSRSIALPEKALDFRDDRTRLARLREVAVAPDFHRLLAIGRQGMRRQRNDRDLVGGRILLEDLRRFPAIDDRDGDVHEDQVGLLRPCFRDPLLAVQRLHYPVPEVP